MTAWIFYPPLKTMSGGCMVLLQIARQLQHLGRLGGVLYWDAPPTYALGQDLPWIKSSQTQMKSGDLYVVPEGWPNALGFGFKAGARCVIYCQNWAYLFHGLENGVRWQQLPVEFWAVSDPVAWHMEQVLGIRPAIIRPAIDSNIFHVSVRRAEGPVRIGFMPRKNKALAEHIRRIFEERNPGASVVWVPIHGMSREQVAETLRSCHIFLVTGFPEGCPLPPLEAMACGCLCVGFTGFGGWDYMRQINSVGYVPYDYALREVPWGGNGWWYPDGDVLGAVHGLEQAIRVLEDDNVQALKDCCQQAAAGYSRDRQLHEAATL